MDDVSPETFEQAMEQMLAQRTELQLRRKEAIRFSEQREIDRRLKAIRSWLRTARWVQRHS